MSFARAHIGDLVVRARSWNPSREASGEFISYIDLSSIDNATKLIGPNDPILADNAPSRARQLVKSGDILVSTVRPNLNGVALVPPDLNGATASTGFCVLRPDSQKLWPPYLFQWVRGPAFVSDMVRKATGASYPAVSDRIIWESEIPLPPSEEQRRLATILDQADDLRQKRQKALATLDKLSKAIFAEMFCSQEPVGRTAKLGEVIKVRSGESLVLKDHEIGGEFPVYGGNGINGYHDKYLVPDQIAHAGRRYEFRSRQGGCSRNSLA